VSDDTAALVAATIAAVQAKRWSECLALCRELLARPLSRELLFDVRRRTVISLLRVADGAASSRRLLDEAIAISNSMLETVPQRSQECASVHRYLADAYVEVARSEGAKDEFLERVVFHCKQALDVEYKDPALCASIEARLAYALMTMTGGDVTSQAFQYNLLEARMYLVSAAKTFSAPEYLEELTEVAEYLDVIDRRLKEFFGIVL
jgi:hypothetical protein